MNWRDAVLASLRGFSQRHRSPVIERQPFLDEELAVIVSATGSLGATPAQTLSRHLQELRDEGVIQFLERGQYLLLDDPIDVEQEDLTDEAIDFALRANRLRLGIVPTDSVPTRMRRRRGQARIRGLITQTYGGQCAVCDVEDNRLLIASHIVGWAESPEHRGNLSNVICLCRFHDALFEAHYWTLTDDLSPLAAPGVTSHTVRVLLEQMVHFRCPNQFRPAVEFVRAHRQRCAFAG